VNQMDWLCNTNGLADQYQVESCSSPVCLTYKEWSAWSTCSRICGGYMTRKRECFPGAEASCNRKYLSQVQECGLKECDNLVISNFLIVVWAKGCQSWSLRYEADFRFLIYVITHPFLIDFSW
jgi:hypothetical protein